LSRIASFSAKTQGSTLAPASRLLGKDIRDVRVLLRFAHEPNLSQKNPSRGLVGGGEQTDFAAYADPNSPERALD